MFQTLSILRGVSNKAKSFKGILLLVSPKRNEVEDCEVVRETKSMGCEVVRETKSRGCEVVRENSKFLTDGGIRNKKMSLANLTEGEFVDLCCYSAGGVIVSMDKHKRCMNVCGAGYVKGLVGPKYDEMVSHSGYKITWDSSFTIHHVMQGPYYEIKGWKGKSLFFFLATLDARIASGEPFELFNSLPPSNALARWAIDSYALSVTDPNEGPFRLSSSQDSIEYFENGRLTKWTEDADLYFFGVHFQVHKDNLCDTFARLYRYWFGKEWTDPTVAKSSKTRAEIMTEAKIVKFAERIVKELEESEDFSIEIRVRSEIVSRVQNILIQDGFSVTHKGDTLTVSCV